MKNRIHNRWSTITLGALLALSLGMFFALDPLDMRPAMAEEGQAAAAEEAPMLPAWADVELVDAVSGETFRISDFAGQPILVESFAVWCSICLRQQKEMAKLVESEGEAIIHVSLDTDPNEDLIAVRQHAERHEFSWLFAVAPVELTQSLIEEFGLTVVNAPRAPVILIGEDGSARLLPNGVKTSDELLEEIEGVG